MAEIFVCKKQQQCFSQTKMWVRVSLTIRLFVCFISVHRNRKQNFNEKFKVFYNERKIEVD